MIRVFTLLIKIEKLDLNVQQLTNIMLDAFLSSKDNYCRKCGASGMKKLERYERKITDYCNGKIEDYVLETLRFICPSCGSTHAYLISLVIPYGRYSLPLVLCALLDLYTKDRTVEQICERYEITPPTLYRWKEQFEKHKALWLGYMKSVETTAVEFLKSLITDEDPEKHLFKEFRELTPSRLSFLQHHRNADNQQYA